MRAQGGILRKERKEESFSILNFSQFNVTA